MVVSKTLSGRGILLSLRERYHDRSSPNLIVVSGSFVRDLVKSTLLANSTPSLKRSYDEDLI